jgi:hypothetical protein
MWRIEDLVFFLYRSMNQIENNVFAKHRTRDYLVKYRKIIVRIKMVSNRKIDEGRKNKIVFLRSSMSSWSMFIQSMFIQWYLSFILIYAKLFLFLSGSIYRWTLWIWFDHYIRTWYEWQEYKWIMAISNCIWLYIFLNVSFYHHLVFMVRIN